MRKLLVLTLGASLCALALFAGPTSAAPNGGGCQLHGTASFSPGLTNSAQAFTYSFTGSLSNCQSSAGGPATGTVFAGTNGLPAASGNGSCGSSTTSGTAVVQWADGTTTVLSYTTSGAAAAVALQGSVIPSAATYTTTRYAGDSALGAVAFEPPDPTACNTPTGVTSAGIDGAVNLGSS